MIPRLEKLQPRILLAGDLDAAELEPQYEVYHPPRLQPGNVPLIGTPAYDDKDQVEIIWQTVDQGEGTDDSFIVEFRQRGTADWRRDVITNPRIDTGSGSRRMHSVTLPGLEWNTEYEYRVSHLRGPTNLKTYEHQFQTRLRPSDSRPFTFAAYGDSSRGGDNRQYFNSVQQQILDDDLDFSVLLGDNIYTFGNHGEADNRFRPDLSPPAHQWTSGHVDYFAIGNHDIFAHQGQPSRDLYSVPVPEAGLNAPASLPQGEFPEHSYSFDYGDVHFVTFDTNVIDLVEPEERTRRLEQLINYVVEDLNASSASWKVVFGHHPFLGTEKRQLPNDIYFQSIVDRLGDADVDLLMFGHSHSYSWTYPISGYSDANADGVVDYDEVEFVVRPDSVFQKGDGVIQLVSGVGGGSLRETLYDQAVFAAGYSQHESTFPLEYGYARVDVTQQRLSVSYISAATGQIVGDHNGNGQRDVDEPYFGRFEIVNPNVTDPDLNRDNQLNSLDIDLMHAALRDGNQDETFDLNRDNIVNRLDATYLLSNVLNTRPGDANLDGRFNSRDLVLAFQNSRFEDTTPESSGWAEGDWNGDGLFTTADLVEAFELGGYSVAAQHADLSLNQLMARTFAHPPQDDNVVRIEVDANRSKSSNAESESDADADADREADVGAQANVSVADEPQTNSTANRDATLQSQSQPSPTEDEESVSELLGCGECSLKCALACSVCAAPLKSAEYLYGE